MIACAEVQDLTVDSWSAALENHNQLKQQYKICSKKVDTTQGIIKELDNVKIIRVTTSGS